MFIMQVMNLQVFQVCRQLILDAVILVCPAADKYRPEIQFGKASDNLVDPAGNPAADVGKGPLQQQHDINLFSPRKPVVSH